jgi:hypothetical protein
MDYYPRGPAPGVAHGAHGHHAHGYGRPVNNVPHLGHGGHPQGHPGHPHHGQHGHGPPPGQPGTQIDEQVLGYVEDLQLGDEHSDVVRHLDQKLGGLGGWLLLHGVRRGLNLDHLFAEPLHV